jgi:hypothetical protein
MKKILVVYYLLALFIFAGFATHGSETPEIFIYSKKYLAVLVVLGIILLGLIPWWMNRFIDKNGTKEFIMSTIPSLVTIGLIYL